MDTMNQMPRWVVQAVALLAAVAVLLWAATWLVENF